MSRALRHTFASLEIPNYRRYFAGQLVSLSGNWMQIVAELWLILAITGSGFAVGVATGLQFLPMLLFGLWGGALADRLSKRRLLIATQALMALPALALWSLTASGAVEPWMVYALVFARGAVNAIDHPARQSFVIEMVGPRRVVNAVGLNSVLVHSARILGPAGAGLVIVTLGVATCFLLNAASFLAMLIALRGMDAGELSPAPRPRDGNGGARAALEYVARTPALAIPLAMMALVGTLGFNFQVVLPLLARFTFDGGPGAYTLLAVAIGVGSVAGALVTGARGRVGPGLLIATAAGFGGFALLAAAAPSLGLAAAALVPLGAVTVTFAAGINSTLQLSATPEMRGRVLALYSVVFLGSTPIGGPVSGWLSGVAGARAALVMAAIAALAAAAGAAVVYELPGLSSAHRRWRRWLRHRGPVAVEARRAQQPDRLERRSRLDVEPDAVAILDRGHRRLAAAPREGDQGRVAGADRGDLRPQPCQPAGGEGERADRPQALERDPARTLRRQRGRRPCGGEDVRDRVGRARRPAEPEADRGCDHPPSRADEDHRRVALAGGDGHRDRGEERRHGGDEEDRRAEQVGEQHQPRPSTQGLSASSRST
ncbi:MAG TPA: MFS transporter [Solirubrobacterales bacterium]|nr:MFS transporter [Solirubrobacterales bacterium]